MIKKIRYLMHDIMRYNFKKYNFRLLLFVGALLVISVLTIDSAADGFARKQMVGIVAGGIGMIFCSLISYNYIAKYRWILYAICIALLAAVLVFGTNINGATRWFKLGANLTLQPSEFAKIGVIVVFSKFLADNKDRINRFSTILITGILYGLPILLIMLESDLSTSLVYVFIFVVMFFVAGLSYKIIGGILAAVVPLGGLFLWYVLQPFQVILNPYQVTRIKTFLNPTEYMATTYLQQYNSVMAIGSGMLNGKGLNNNTLTSVKGGDFISEPQTDFIFAVIGEELGFIGSCAVVILLFLVVIECLLVAKDASDMTGRLIASSVAGMIAFQAFVNIGVASALLPNTGLPLPFISYGLSSLVSNLLAIGLVLNVGLQRNRR